MFDSLRPHELQHARPPCPSPTPGVHWDSRPPSQWCHPAISSSVVPFPSCPQSLPASESFPMSQLFAWGGQSTGVSALASFLPKKSQIEVVKFRWGLEGKTTIMELALLPEEETRILSLSVSDDTWEGGHLLARKRALTKNGVFQHFDIGLPNLQKYEESLLFKTCSPRILLQSVE